MKKIVQKDRPLPLKRGVTEKVYKRKDSSIYQVRFVGPNGKLVRLSTGTRSKTAAQQALPMFKREFFRRFELPPPGNRDGGDAFIPELF